MALKSDNMLSNKIANALVQADIKFTRKVGLGTRHDAPFVMSPDINIYTPYFETIMFTLLFDKDNGNDYDVEFNEDYLHKLGQMSNKDAKKYQDYSNHVNKVLGEVIGK